MREIEFRGFSRGDGPDVVRIAGPDGSARFCWGRWLTGSLVLWADGDTAILIRGCDSYHMTQCFVLPGTVGEWTGYCDKNGRRIFEGDRVRLSGDSWPDGPETADVAMHRGCWCVRSPSIDWDFLSTNAKDAEVIGTVYDPEVTGDDRA